MEGKIYQILKKHKLSPKKREEVLADLLLLMDEIKQAKEKEYQQQKIAYKISTPLGHVDHSIDTYGIDITITEYKVKVLNNKHSFWEECLAIAKFCKQFKNK